MVLTGWVHDAERRGACAGEGIGADRSAPLVREREKG
jgi:hypothetical protein